MHMSLAAVLGESAVRYGNRTAIVENDEQISYATLWRQARAYATALGDLGVEPGFTVALMLPTSSDFIRSYFGALALGAVVVPVNILLTAEEVEFVLRDSGASALVADESVLDVAVSASNAAGTDLFTVGGGATRPGTDGGRARLDLLAGLAEPIPTAVLRRPDHAAVVLYTSGTTGKPKGAVLTHSNMLMNATIMAFDAIDLRSDDRVLCCLPLFHTFGQSVTMNATLRRGATLVLMSRFRGDGALDLMAEQDVTVFQGVPTMYMALLDAAAGRDVVHKLRFCLPEELRSRLLCWSRWNVPSRPRYLRATACLRPHRSSRSISRLTACVTAPWDIPSGASRRRSPAPKSRTASNSSQRARSARSWFVVTVSSRGT
jgi:long-chain acyl-CoA synthetase